MYNEWVILGLVFAVVGAGFYFFLRTKMDPRVEELANLAYGVAAKIAGLPARGSTPPVGLKAKRWISRSVSKVGSYRSFGFFGKVFWDSILVVNAPSYIWRNTVHEMTHAVRRRNGKSSSERAAEAAEARADDIAPPNLAALLEKL